MNVWNYLAGEFAKFSAWTGGFWDSAANLVLDTGALMFGQLLDLGMGILSGIPLPDSLINFTWPSAGPLGPLFRSCGLVEALGILSACWTIRFLLKLTVIFG